MNHSSSSIKNVLDFRRKFWLESLMTVWRRWCTGRTSAHLLSVKPVFMEESPSLSSHQVGLFTRLYIFPSFRILRFCTSDLFRSWQPWRHRYRSSGQEHVLDGLHEGQNWSFLSGRIQASGVDRHRSYQSKSHPHWPHQRVCDCFKPNSSSSLLKQRDGWSTQRVFLHQIHLLGRLEQRISQNRDGLYGRH